MKAPALSILLLLSGCATHEGLAESTARARDEDSLAIFHTVLQSWLDRNERGSSIYVSKSTHSLPERELQKFEACANSETEKPSGLAFAPPAKVVGNRVGPTTGDM